MRILTFIQTIIIILTCTSSVFADELSNAKAYVLMEAKTGQILAAKNEEEKLPPASTTKILTAIMAIERGQVEREILVSPAAASVGEASIHLESGEKISVLNLLKGALIKSGNDASYALAEYVGGTEELFLFLMNRKAKIIGANTTSFYNSNGLPHQDHLSTAKDLALMARYGLSNQLFASIVAKKEDVIPWGNYSWQRKLTNTNKLLWRYEGADGVKTGTTRAAGNCLVASATKNNRQLIAVVLHSPDRFGEAANLLDYGFNNTSLKKISKGLECGSAYLAKSCKRIPLVTACDYEFTVFNSSKLRQRIVITENSKKKIKQGEYLGFLEIFDSNEVLARIPLVASLSS